MSAIASAVGDASNPSEVLYLVAQVFLRQALDLLHSSVRTDDQLAATSRLSPGSSVGKHLRHLADHYKALLDALEGSATPSAPSSSSASTSSDPRPPPSSSSAGTASGAADSSHPPPSSASSAAPITLDYDNRSRNVLAEHSHAAAVKQFEDLSARLERLMRKGTAIEAEREVRLTATTPVRVEVKTSFARELWFASFHAVHHFALIRVIVCGELGLTVPEDFGVAPSTLKARESEGSAAAPSAPTKL
ncbi:hypothetical protein JCM10207_004530 [Rhodosporidiobolus poonsookiae]